MQVSMHVFFVTLRWFWQIFRRLCFIFVTFGIEVQFRKTLNTYHLQIVTCGVTASRKPTRWQDDRGWSPTGERPTVGQIKRRCHIMDIDYLRNYIQQHILQLLTIHLRQTLTQKKIFASVPLHEADPNVKLCFMLESSKWKMYRNK